MFSLGVFLFLDRKNCENISDKPEDLTPNMTSFVWTPEFGAKVIETWCSGIHYLVCIRLFSDCPKNQLP